MSSPTGNRCVLIAPVRRREWIIEDWFKYALRSVEISSLKLTDVVVISDQDDPSLDALWRTMRLSGVQLNILHEPDFVDTPYVRQWSMDRYERMTFLRNQLLTTVRGLAPDYCLSVDTDILMHPQVVSNLVESQQQFQWDAVGGKVFLSHNERQAPSYATINQKSKNLHRPDVLGQIQVDVIMALKLLTPKSYWVDYVAHRQGEDIGYSLNCKSQGLTLGFDGRVTSRHVWDEKHR